MHWKGPFEILERKNGHDYRVQLKKRVKAIPCQYVEEIMMSETGNQSQRYNRYVRVSPWFLSSVRVPTADDSRTMRVECRRQTGRPDRRGSFSYDQRKTASTTRDACSSIYAPPSAPAALLLADVINRFVRSWRAVAGVRGSRLSTRNNDYIHTSTVDCDQIMRTLFRFSPSWNDSLLNSPNLRIFQCR